MENKNELDSGFRVLNIITLNLAFTRQQKVTFNDSRIRPKVNVEVGYQLEGNKVVVTENVEFSQEVDGVEEYSISTKVVGLFEVVGQPKLGVDEFGRVNGPAIIFPYVRETITSICFKAGLGAVYIPPFDFTKNRKPVEGKQH